MYYFNKLFVCLSSIFLTSISYTSGGKVAMTEGSMPGLGKARIFALAPGSPKYSLCCTS